MSAVTSQLGVKPMCWQLGLGLATRRARRPQACIFLTFRLTTAYRLANFVPALWGEIKTTYRVCLTNIILATNLLTLYSADLAVFLAHITCSQC